jgi:hypothetical protein
VRFNCQLRAIGKVVPNPTATYHEDYFKRLCDFGGYMSWNIAFSVLVIAELCTADAHLCSELRLGDPGSLSSHSDLSSEFLLPSHRQYIDRIKLSM